MADMMWDNSFLVFLLAFGRNAGAIRKNKVLHLFGFERFAWQSYGIWRS